MDVILHLGAHRTGSTSFQRFMQANARALANQSIGFWGPGRTRKGLLHGVADRPETPDQTRRAVGRVQLNMKGAARNGAAVLIVSDENMIGTARRCLRARLLYPEVGERMARLNGAFSPIRRVVLQIRSLESWWASSMAYLIPRGGGIPPAAALEQLSLGPRSWRHVITDLACACPDAEILVSPFERYGPRPDRLFAEMTGSLFPPKARPDEFWVNQRPRLPQLRAVLEERGEDPDMLPRGDGRWHPFSDLQAARLREAYADDLFWLRAGADGLARLTEDPEPAKPAIQLVAGLDKRGQNDDGSARRLAPTR
ncbi:hypothetical protein [Tropicibacter oceani]|uniref:Sulfotransferase family protein n=1 Tax=Tropicibacter oceani TaxID=3058420 RepID=A0ABY8QCG7_9RHOB|nr:hypothetical protein [Tropicibacter oceani]WGW02250.1 hypothetical protein QF118_09790 [Tropicibacter oceani]